MTAEIDLHLLCKSFTVNYRQCSSSARSLACRCTRARGTWVTGQSWVNTIRAVPLQWHSNPQRENGAPSWLIGFWAGFEDWGLRTVGGDFHLLTAAEQEPGLSAATSGLSASSFSLRPPCSSHPGRPRYHRRPLHPLACVSSFLHVPLTPAGQHKGQDWSR